MQGGVGLDFIFAGSSIMKEKEDPKKYEVTPAGSLGLLALGYRGVQAWREARDETLRQMDKNQKP